MSLFISNRATAKQIAILKKLEYCGKWDLTVEEAAQIIDELFEEERLTRQDMDATEADLY